MSEVLKIGDPAPSFQLSPVFGLPVQVPGRRSLLVFLRPLSSASTRSFVAALQSVHQSLDGVQVVQFTRSSLEVARDFVPRQHVLLPMVSDPEGLWYARYGVASGIASILRNPASLLQYPSRLSLGHGPLEAPYGQCSAAFVVEADGRLRWCWRGRSFLDLPDVPTLVEEATR